MTTPVVIQSIGERVRCIAALHALIAYLEANPDLPAPSTIDARYHVHGGTAWSRKDMVADAAETMGVVMEGTPDYFRAKTEFGATEPASLGFTYAVITHATDARGI